MAEMLGLASLLLSGCVRDSAPSTAATRETRRAAVDSLVFVAAGIGAPMSEFGRPMVTHVKLVDLDRDGLLDVLYAEARRNTVRWIRQSPRGVFTDEVLAEVRAPAHVDAADLNGTGRLDVLVASMGQIMPINDRIGAVIVLENLDNKKFRPRVLLAQTARVTDVRAADLAGHGDGRLDLVVGQFGYAQGETRWMENKGDWHFDSHVVNTQSGCIHTPVADFDADGRPDFMALISQEWEEIHWFQNLGHGQVRDAPIWGSTNEDYGSSGLEVADVNRDGKPDLIYTNGDGFDYAVQVPRQWHGIRWLANRGGGNFKLRSVGNLPGAYSPCAADLDGDGDVDLLAVSTLAFWSDPQSVSMMAWLNDGREDFTPVVLAHRPIQLVTAAVGDLDGNGIPAIVTGGFHALPPFENMSSVTVWRRK